MAPSFAGVQQKIDAEAAKWGAGAGKAFRRTFNAEVNSGPVPNPGPSDADAAKQGEDAGKAYRGGFRTGLGSGSPLPSPGPSSGAARRDGANSGGAYADAFRRKLEEATRALPPVRIGVATSQAESDLRDLRRDLETLTGKTVGVDIDAADAVAEMERIDAELKRLGASTADPQIKIDSASASASIEALRAELKRLSGDRVEVDVTLNEGAFVTRARAAVEKAQAALPRLELDADSTPAQVEIQRIRASMQSLGDKKIGVDISAAEFNAEATRLTERLDVITRNRSVDIQLRTDAAAAAAALAAANAEVNRLDGRTARVDVDSSSINTFSGRLVLLGTAIGSILPALVPIGGAALVGIGGIGAAASAAIPAVGALVLGLHGVGEALKQMGKVDEESAAVAGKNSEARQQQAQAQAAAARQIESAEASLANTRANAAQAAERAARQVADAQARVADAEAEAAKAAEDSAERVANAQQSVQDARDEAARSAEESARRIADADQSLVDAREEAARAAVQSARRVADAEQSLADAQEASARAAEQSAQRITDAKENAARAQARMVKDIETALRRQEDAEKALARTQDDARKAQEDLTQARKDAQDQLEDLDFRAQKSALDQRQAVLDLADAQRELDDVRANPTASDDEREQAEIRFKEAQLQLQQLQVENQRLAEEQADAAKNGVEGSDTVVSAQERLQAAVQATADAEQAAADAATAVEDQRAELRQRALDDGRAIAEAQAAAALQAEQSARSITDAEQGLQDAREASSLQAEQSARRVADAERDAVDAREAAALAGEQSTRRVADAEGAAADAVEAADQSRIDGLARIADAQTAVADAVTAQAEQQRSATFSVEQAERSLQGARESAAAAAVAGGVAATAAMQSLQTAMDNLSPTQQRFAEYLYGLRDEVGRLQDASAEGMLPGFQRGLEALMPVLPIFEDILFNVGTALGQLGQQIGEALASDAWRPFLDFLRDEGGPLLLQFGQIIGNLATALLPGLVAAFGPIASTVLGVLEQLTGRFADFLLSAQSSDAFQSFMDYVVTNAPKVGEFLGALGDAFVNIIKSMAPFGPVILGIITGLLNFIAAIPPGVLSFIALAVVGIVSAFTLLGPVIGFVGGIIASVSAGLPILGAVLAALGGPVTLIIAGVVLLGAAFLAAWEHSEKFRSIIYAIGDGLSWFGGYLKDLGGDVIAGFLLPFQHPEVLWEGLQAAFWGIIDGVKALFGIHSPSTVFAEIGGFIIAGLLNAIQDGMILIQKVFEGLITFWQNVLAPAVTFLWERVFKPAFDGIGNTVKWAWENVIQPALVALKWYWDNILGPAVAFWWHQVFEPAFKGIGDAVATAWEKVIKPALDALIGFWNNTLGPAVAFWWHNVIERAFTGIGAAVTGAWGVIKLALDALINYWNTVLGPAVDFWWHQVFEPAFNGIGGIVKSVWESVISPALNALKDFFEKTLGPAIDAGVGAFTTAWDKMKKAAADPINFVINTVYTNGIKALFDKVAEAVGSDVRLPTVSPVAFARGGVLPGMSSWRDGDDQLVSMRRGEGVAISEAMRVPQLREELLRWNQIGLSGGTGALTRYAQGFAKGGIVDLGHWFQGKGADVAEHPAFGGVHPVHKGRGHYEGRAIDVNHGAGTSAGEQAFFDQYANKLKAAGWTVYWRVPGHFNHLHAEEPTLSFKGEMPDGGGFLSSVGDFISGAWDAAKSVLGDLNPVEALKNKASEMFAGIGAAGPLVDIAKGTVGKSVGLIGDKLSSIISAINPFDGGTEDDTVGALGGGAAANRSIVQQKAAARGWATGAQWSALDWLVNKESSYDNTAQNPTSTAYGLFQFLNSTWAGVGGKKTSNPNLQTDYGLKYIAQNGNFRDPIGAKKFHQSHGWYWPGGIIGSPQKENLSAKPYLFDQGGVVPPGYSTIVNATRQPEALLNPRQWADIRSVALDKSRQSRDVNFYGPVQQSTAADIARELQKQQRQAEALAF